MGHTHQNCPTLKYESHWAKWVTFGQMGKTLENESLFINMGHTYQNCRTLKYKSHWAKWVTFGQMGHTWESESHCKHGSQLSKLWYLEV